MDGAAAVDEVWASDRLRMSLLTCPSRARPRELGRPYIVRAPNIVQPRLARSGKAARHHASARARSGECEARRHHQRPLFTLSHFLLGASFRPVSSLLVSQSLGIRRGHKVYFLRNAGSVDVETGRSCISHGRLSLAFALAVEGSRAVFTFHAAWRRRAPFQTYKPLHSLLRAHE